MSMAFRIRRGRRHAATGPSSRAAARGQAHRLLGRDGAVRIRADHREAMAAWRSPAPWGLAVACGGRTQCPARAGGGPRKPLPWRALRERRVTAHGSGLVDPATRSAGSAESVLRDPANANKTTSLHMTSPRSWGGDRYRRVGDRAAASDQRRIATRLGAEVIETEIAIRLGLDPVRFRLAALRPTPNACSRRWRRCSLPCATPGGRGHTDSLDTYNQGSRTACGVGRRMARCTAYRQPARRPG
jgi:hypothetical protein